MNNETDRDRRIGDLLEYDAIAVGEDMAEFADLGPEAGMALGFALHMDAMKRREEALTSIDDTVFRNDLERYLRIAEAEGFTEALRVPFTVQNSYSDGVEMRQETLFVFFHDRDGILLVFDTYDGVRVNGGHFYYNWVPRVQQEDPWMRVVSSGRWCGERLWAGDHDCREALRFNLRRLRQHGSFLPSWRAQPFLWLLHHGDHPHGKKCDYDTIMQERLWLLPKYVQKRIAGDASRGREDRFTRVLV